MGGHSDEMVCCERKADVIKMMILVDFESL